MLSLFLRRCGAVRENRAPLKDGALQRLQILTRQRSSSRFPSELASDPSTQNATRDTAFSSVERGIDADSRREHKMPYIRVGNEQYSTLDSRWRGAIAKLLDKDELPVGSFDQIQWQVAKISLFWCSKNDHEGLSLSLKILDRIVQEPQQGLGSGKRFTGLVTAVLEQWNSLYKVKRTSILPSFLELKIRAYANVYEWFEPNIFHYTLILDGASHSMIPEERLEFTESLIQWLLDESEQHPHLRPTVVTFSSVINAWTRLGKVEDVQRAEQLFRRMISLEYLQPNVIVYTTVINGWAKAGYAARAETIFQEMVNDYVENGNQGAKPNTVSFNTVLSAWARSPSPNASQTVQKLIEKMEEIKKNGALDVDVTLNTNSYNYLMAAYSKSRDPTDVDKAMDLASNMLQRSRQGEPALAPCHVTFEMLLRTINTSGADNKQLRLKRALELIEEAGLERNPRLMDLIRL